MSRKLLLAISAQVAVSRSLRTIERKSLDQAQLMRIRTRLATGGLPERSIARIMKTASKHRVVSLLPSGKERIRSPMKGKNDAFVIHANINVPDPLWIDEAATAAEHAHMERTVYLRRELRAAHLAYAFLIGVKLEEAEQSGRDPIPFDRIEEIADMFCDDTSLMIGFQAWKINAVAHGKHPEATKLDTKSKNDVKRAQAKNERTLKSDYGRVF